jgi:hypothetical protein
MRRILIWLFFLHNLSAQSQDSLQQARLKNLQGKILPFSSIARQDSLILVCFWSLNSEESISELNYINANLQNWQSAKPFRFMAVSIDEGKTANRMRPVYNMNGWTFDTYVDLYGDLRRSLHSNNLPQSYILYKNVKIYEQSGWTEGSENYLFHRLTAIKN